MATWDEAYLARLEKDAAEFRRWAQAKKAVPLIEVVPERPTAPERAAPAPAVVPMAPVEPEAEVIGDASTCIRSSSMILQRFLVRLAMATVGCLLTGIHPLLGGAFFLVWLTLWISSTVDSATGQDGSSHVATGRPVRQPVESPSSMSGAGVPK